MVILLLLMLVWQQALSSCATPTRYPRQVAGVPQYVLDYGME